MTQPDPIVLDVDAGGYVQGLGDASEANSRFIGSLRGVATAQEPMRRGMALITPSRATLAGFTALAYQAGQAQAQLATMSAQAKTTGANMGTLTSSMRQLARDIPIGNAGSRELFRSLTGLGVAAAGTEQNMGKLAQRFGKLGGATGEGPAQLAQGFIQLNRSMNTGFDANRMGKLADSLTTVAAKSGSSATGVLAFAKSIAPMAQASGIGETKVLGISAAFTKLGEDGFGAANAFNKMLGDLSRSVREGSPLLNTYAQIVGKTSDQFGALFKSNPTEAITQVTEALAKNRDAPRQLESLGLDGVRTQRYLQTLAQSGGLREAVAQSTAGYGSGATDTAAREAFKGLADSSQRAAANAEQLAEALGAPLLGPLTVFTKALGAATTPARALVGSSAVQNVMTGAVWTAAVGALALKVIRPLVTGAWLAQAATSAPIRGMFAGMALGRAGGDVAMAQQGLLGRLGGQAIPLAAGGQPITQSRVMSGPANAAVRAGSFVGGFLGQGAGGPGIFRQGFGLGLTGLTMYAQSFRESARQARIPAWERGASRMSPYGARFDAWRNERMALRPQIGPRLPAEVIAARTAAANAALREAMRSQGIGQNLGMLGRAGLGMAGQGLASGAVLGGQAALGAARGAMALTGGPIGLALLGASVGVPMLMHARSKGDALDIAESEKARSGSVSFIDDYRVALGKATVATSTFAGRLEETARTMTEGITSMGEAFTVDAKAISIAEKTGKQIRQFSGTNESVAAQLRSEFAINRPTPDMVAAIRTDLIKEFGSDRAREILGAVGPARGLRQDYSGDIAAQVQGVADQRRKRGWGGSLTPDVSVENEVTGSKRLAPDSRLSTLTDDQKQLAQDIASQVVQRGAAREDAGGRGYAIDQARKEMDAAVEAAYKADNYQLAQELQKRFQDKAGIDRKNYTELSWKEIQDAGGFSAALEGRQELFKDRFGSEQASKAWQSQRSYIESALGGNALVGVLSGTGRTTAAAAVNRLTGPEGQPESPQAQMAAVQATLREFGGDMVGLAASAASAANELGNVADPTHQLAMALVSAATAARQYAQQDMGSGAVLAERGKMALDKARIVPTNADTQALHDQGVSEMREIEGQAKDQARARLHAQREFQVSSARQEQAYQLQVDYANHDFGVQMVRAEEDFGKQRFRVRRDYNIGRADAEEDFNKQVLRANRDFNKALRRQIEDAAKTMYDPYTRIPAHGTWDINNLTGNMAEQNRAMQLQIANLAKIRRAGVTNQAITLLGLNDPSNAQQLATIVGDLVSSPQVVAALNAQARAKQSLSGALLGDPSNPTFTRQREDFRQAMADQSKDFSVAMSRGARQLRITLSTMQIDFSTSMVRANTDHKTSMNRMNAQYRIMLTQAREDLKRGDEQITGDLASLTAAMNRAISGQAVNFRNLTVSSLRQTAAALRTFQNGEWQDLVNGFGYTFGIYPLVPGAGRLGESMDPGWGPSGPVGGAAAGAISRAVPGGRMLLTAEAGHDEAIIPLNARGADYMAQVMGRMISQNDLRTAATAGYSTVVNNPLYHYDSSVNVEKVEVVANDANAFAASMAARRRANLTAPEQMRR